jgi:hypothetical protein
MIERWRVVIDVTAAAHFTGPFMPWLGQLQAQLSSHQLCTCIGEAQYKLQYANMLDSANKPDGSAACTYTVSDCSTHMLDSANKPDSSAGCMCACLQVDRVMEERCAAWTGTPAHHCWPAVGGMPW